MAGNSNSGRRRKPVGASGDRRISFPVPSGKAVRPKWLDERAVVEWKRIGPELAKLGLLTAADQAEFANYCQCVADLERARKLITTGVWSLTTGHKRPAIFSIVADLQDRIHRLAGSLGLNPASRESMAIRVPTRTGKTGTGTGLASVIGEKPKA